MLKRTSTIEGKTYKLNDGQVKTYLIINYIKENNIKKPIEIFIIQGKAGKTLRSAYDTLGRCLSTMLKYNIPLLQIVKNLKGVEGNSIFFENQKFKSIEDGLARLLEKEFMTNKDYDIPERDTVFSGKPLRASDIAPELEPNIIIGHPDPTQDGALIDLLQGNPQIISETSEGYNSLNECPECSSDLIYTEGCEKCSSCDYNRC